MFANPFTQMQFCRRRATGAFLHLIALAASFSTAVALAQPVRVMPVVPQGSPTTTGPNGWALVDLVLYFNHPAPGGTGVPALWKYDGVAGPVLVKDVNTDLSNPSRFTASGGRFYFPGGTPGSSTHPQGLWVSDGTLAGTQVLRQGNLNEIADVNGAVFFVDGGRLFKSNGTPAGTLLVRDHGSLIPSGLTNVNGTLVYAITAPGGGLWKSDGTTPGTVLLKSFTSIQTTPTGVHAGKLFFSADDGAGAKLWTTDGTVAGTVQISVGAGPLMPSHFRAPSRFLPHIYFSASDGVSGRELWRSDGTVAGTVMIADIEPGPGDSIPQDFGVVPYAGEVPANPPGIVFSAYTTAHGRELWRTDGTAAGTVLLKDFNPGPADSFPTQFRLANGAQCFIVGTGGSTRELWSTDGSVARTFQIVPDVRHTFTDPELVSTFTRLFYKRLTPNGFQLWSTSCNSPDHEELVKEFPLAVSDPAYIYNSLTSMGDHVMLRAFTAAEGRELWRADASGSALVKDIEPGPGSGLAQIGSGIDPIGPQPPGPAWLRVGNLFFFSAATSAHGTELWKSDGTPAGTVMVKDILPGAAGSYPWGFTDVNGTLYFIANDGASGYELWKSDGTEAGTALVKDINPGINSSFTIGLASLMNVNGTLYFRADDLVSGMELWKSDGTAAGTVLVKDIFPGPDHSSPYMLGDVGGALMFVARTPEHGYELWRSDGTAAGTVLVKDIRPGSGNGTSGVAVVMNGVLYFADVEGTVSRLWRSDGTTAGTTPVFTAPAGFVGGRLTAIGNTLYFWTNGFPSSAWRSDGTEAGTVLLRSFGDQSSVLGSDKFVAVGGVAHFLAMEGGTQGLWRTDGTAAGTYEVQLFPGFKAANPVELTAVGDRLYFIANDGVNPRSLYYYIPRSPAAEVTRLGNLSSRMLVLTGENVMIGGFVIGGQAAKRVAIVATGPSLSAYGIAGPMQNPTIRLVRSADGATIATNDDWQSASNASQLQAAGFAPPDPREAAILADLAPGAYTAILQGANGAMGVAVVGIYELDQPGVPLVNLAARGLVSSGENVMIAGFIIQGPNPQTVAVVATGPSLAGYGIANPLANPALTIVRASDGAVVAVNDNWMDAANAPQLEGKGFAPPNANEAAVLVTLPPGAYTAVVSGSGGSTGIGLVGVYRVN